jgi:hypothetical protein
MMGILFKTFDSFCIPPFIKVPPALPATAIPARVNVLVNPPLIIPPVSFLAVSPVSVFINPCDFKSSIEIITAAFTNVVKTEVNLSNNFKVFSPPTDFINPLTASTALYPQSIKVTNALNKTLAIFTIKSNAGNKIFANCSNFGRSGISL